jgi:dihydroflavonol-4-reductase
MQKSAFVTGATGFVGLNLIEELLRQGWHVTALHRPTSDLRYLSRLAADRVAGDVTDAESIRRALPPKVDVIFHVAGDTSVWSGNNARQNRINLDGTRNMVEAARARGAVRFVYTSSVAVFGTQGGLLNENSPRLGRSSPINYQRSKFFAEEEVRSGIARGLDAVILNPASIVGPYDVRGYATLFRVVADGGLPGVPPGRRSFCDVREVARAHVTAAERGRAGESYILGGTDASLLEFFGEIGAAINVKVPTRPMPALLVRALGWAGALQSKLTGRAPFITPELANLSLLTFSCDCAKAVRELDFRIVPLHDMVASCAEWLMAEGLLPRGKVGAPGNWYRRA